ncbi:hypothetical protein VHEMI03980 [[Torrubiella] hemipterigena]|uniref:Conidiation-specific expression protein n=1 Tax=[Torrubiella] hemipterigena TaxID=1531966 RepID=A0A0A1TCH1_9HYPO|nr:hypothetical protein VHEMI03980 [[Torrubiella] hemipterigena]
MNTEQPPNPPTVETQPRRRSSSFMPSFDSLQQHRHGEQSTARRQSMHDQNAKPGLFGQFFHSTWGRNAK